MRKNISFFFLYLYFYTSIRHNVCIICILTRTIFSHSNKIHLFIWAFICSIHFNLQNFEILKRSNYFLNVVYLLWIVYCKGIMRYYYCLRLCWGLRMVLVIKFGWKNTIFALDIKKFSPKPLIKWCFPVSIAEIYVTQYSPNEFIFKFNNIPNMHLFVYVCVRECAIYIAIKFTLKTITKKIESIFKIDHSSRETW